MSGYAGSLKIGGTGAALGGMQLLVDTFQEKHPEVSGEVLPSLGSGGGIKALSMGVIDIAVSSRQLKPKEQGKGLEEHVYAKTAIVLATPKKNKTTDISSDELISIIDGTKTTWADGSDIRIVLRPETEIDVKILKIYVPEIVGAWDRLKDIPGVPMAYTDQMTADLVQLMPGGFGISTLALIKSEERALTALSFNNTEPSIETIADGSYPLVKSFYYITALESGEITKKFIVFMQSEEGREILQKSGHYVPSPDGG